MTVHSLVAGGNGYLGGFIVRRLTEAGHAVRVVDIEDSSDRPASAEFVKLDITDRAAVAAACRGMDFVFNCVASLPLARDAAEHHRVNIDGTQNLLEACESANVTKLVHISTSAVYGSEALSPITLDTPCTPAESYGRTKLAGEALCKEAERRGVDVSIIRPRTIVGPGRLGLFDILFNWVADGADVFVFGRGNSVYQFVHPADVAETCLLAAERSGPAVYNVGAEKFTTMRATLESLCEHAGTGAKVRSLPARPAAAAMKLASKLRLAPFSDYHWLVFGKSVYFDVSTAKHDLGWSARYSNQQMFADGYDWYVEHRASISATEGSMHRRGVNQRMLTAVKAVMRTLRPVLPR
jgi:nucleoside-diphosphate-sugar epimerase